MYHAEKEADYADMLLEKYSDARDRLKLHTVEEKEEDKVVAKFRIEKEKKAAIRFEQRRVKKQERLKKQMRAQDILAKTRSK